jgi:hypothetical protein
MLCCRYPRQCGHDAAGLLSRVDHAAKTLQGSACLLDRTTVLFKRTFTQESWRLAWINQRGGVFDGMPDTYAFSDREILTR